MNIFNVVRLKVLSLFQLITIRPKGRAYKTPTQKELFDLLGITIETTASRTKEKK